MNCIGVIFTLIGGLFIVLMIKNEITFINHNIISNAIYAYGIQFIRESEGKFLDIPVQFSDCEDYDKTLWRLWDWGYKRILPREKFELIKPYICRRTHRKGQK